MKPTQTQVALGLAAVTGVAAVATAWFFSTRKRCSAVKVAGLVSTITAYHGQSFYPFKIPIKIQEGGKQNLSRHHTYCLDTF